MDWKAVCLTCSAETGLPEILADWPNGELVEAEAKAHIKDNPDHEVLVGYSVKEVA